METPSPPAVDPATRALIVYLEYRFDDERSEFFPPFQLDLRERIQTENEDPSFGERGANGRRTYPETRTLLRQIGRVPIRDDDEATVVVREARAEVHEVALDVVQFRVCGGRKRQFGAEGKCEF